jgi:hypothetical protein
MAMKSTLNNRHKAPQLWKAIEISAITDKTKYNIAGTQIAGLLFEFAIL